MGSDGLQLEPQVEIDDIPDSWRDSVLDEAKRLDAVWRAHAID
jgi:hypothetical protein